MFDYSWSKIKIGSLIEHSIPWQPLLFVLAKGLELTLLHQPVLVVLANNTWSSLERTLPCTRTHLLGWASLKLELLDLQLSLNPLIQYLGVESLASFCSRAHLAISLMAREKNTPEFLGYWPSSAKPIIVPHPLTVQEFIWDGGRANLIIGIFRGCGKRGTRFHSLICSLACFNMRIWIFLD